MESRIERTFAMIKPDGMDRVGEVLQQVQHEHFTIERMRLIQLLPSGVQRLYAAHVKKPFYAKMERFLIERPVICMVLARPNATTYWRNVLGSTDSRNASPYSLRGRFGNKRGIIFRNVAHGSDSPDAAFEEEAMMVRGQLGVAL